MSAPKILVIEDNPGDVQLLRYGLSQHDEPYELFHGALCHRSGPSSSET